MGLGSDNVKTKGLICVEKVMQWLQVYISGHMDCTNVQSQQQHYMALDIFPFQQLCGGKKDICTVGGTESLLTCLRSLEWIRINPRCDL